MAGDIETVSVPIRPLGAGGDEIVEVSETVAIGDPTGRYWDDGRNWRLFFRPRTASEARDLVRSRDDVGHRRLVTRAGVALIFIVTLAAVAGFLGITNSTAPNAHEDAVRLLILIVGAAIGTVFGAVVVANKDPA